MANTYSLYNRVLILAVIIFIGACTNPVVNENKLSPMLQQQIELRQQQIKDPSGQNLQHMQELGMIIDDIRIQRMYIYLQEPLTAVQENELTSLGIKIHLDSWIPPVGNHPYGFFIAEAPVDKVAALAAKDYIVKLDTAERQSLPTCEIIPR